MISFTIPGEPQGKGRARAFVKDGAIGHYTPGKTASYEKLIGTAAKMKMIAHKIERIEGPVAIRIFAYMGIAKSWPKKRQEAARSGKERPTKKPDIDNLAKSVLDGLNGIAYADDAQVVALCVFKYWSDRPRVEVHVDEAKQ